MLHRYSYFYLLFFLCGAHLLCSNYLGNPYKTPVAPRTVPVSADDLRVEPANWWIGMQHNRVEIMVHRAGVAAMQVRMGEDARGIRLSNVQKLENPNYLFVTLLIDPKAPPQKVPLYFSAPDGGASFSLEYPLLARDASPKAQGVDSRDVVYLIMPDRFSNGDPSNDNVPGMYEGRQRDSLTGRHGGDLQGIINHLDYLQDLGINTLWLNPELENDQDGGSYHGYAVTDHYRIDRRLGTNELYRELVRQCHERDMKVIRDVVTNHIGHRHWWMQDLPSQDWLNQWSEMTITNYRAPTLIDPYAAEADKKGFSDGWFVPSMPDLNQRQPQLANYLIQQAIWWVEYAGIDAFRIDTYTYSDQKFMSRWCREIREEYPAITLFGEVWEQGVLVQGAFADDQPLDRLKLDSNLPGMIDFQLTFAIQDALTKPPAWNQGVDKVYYTLASDVMYHDPYRNLIMLDNHDMSRFFSVIGQDMNKFKSGIAFLLTMRGVPQLYYMTEILGTGLEYPSHGNIRKDFPGGWPGDKVNKFSASGRTPQENEAYNYTRTLIRYRNATPALQNGYLMQFVPQNGVYVYFRYDDAKTVMVILNTSGKDQSIPTARFAERLKGATNARNVVSGQVLNDIQRIEVKKDETLVLEIGG